VTPHSLLELGTRRRNFGLTQGSCKEYKLDSNFAPLPCVPPCHGAKKEETE